MGQYWEIAALGRKKVLPKGGQKLGEFLFDSRVTEALERGLAVPVVPTHHDSRPENVKTRHDAAVGTIDRKSGSFPRFPTEIHCLIFEHCYDDDLASVVSLGVTNRYFWSVARDYIVRDFTQCLGVWAGQQLITVGDYVQLDDYPPGLFATEEEKENLLKSRSEDDDVDESLGEQRSVTLYDRIVNSFETQDPEAISRSRGWDYFHFGRLRALGKDPGYRAVSHEIYMKRDDFYPQDEVWILRNLTTHQYVRREPLELQPGLAHGPFVRGIGFGCVVLSRISWSSDPSVSLQDPTGRIHRGVWAGHRFDITTMTRHEKLTAGQNWTDVTEELVEEVTAIWAADLGPDWKQYVLGQHD
ncbi:hypothetical protein C2857_000970 [Epichloe festucae Fl1]|uniref:F-box domain-containing protein n=1 Tax=Epichloe festucae (strain Fl1) TaxID=877507 RepID=A0A7S9KNF5_EPIFF|nr:hypothetical protein C2857_000970 [Epichloe festucae Fl1]